MESLLKFLYVIRDLVGNNSNSIGNCRGENNIRMVLQEVGCVGYGLDRAGSE